MQIAHTLAFALRKENHAFKRKVICVDKLFTAFAVEFRFIEGPPLRACAHNCNSDKLGDGPMIKQLKGLSVLCLVVIVASLCHSSRFTAVGQTGRYAGTTITGTVYFVGGRASGRSRPFTLIINRYTTPEEISELNSALQSGGQDTLLRTLSKMNAGRIEIGTGVGVTANAIIASQEEGRTKLIVLYERNLRFAELRFGSRSEDYKFGYTELYLGQGNHEGMLIPAAKVRLRGGNTWEVEDFGTFPARLMGLQVHGGGREAR